MKIKPLNNNVYLLEEKETVTKSGIVLPETGNAKTGIFTIYEIAENEQGLKKGMRVLASKFSGEEVELKEDGKVVLLKACQIDTISALVHD